MKKVWEVGLENADGNDLIDELERLRNVIKPDLTKEQIQILSELDEINYELTKRENQ